MKKHAGKPKTADEKKQHYITELMHGAGAVSAQVGVVLRPVESRKAEKMGGLEIKRTAILAIALNDLVDVPQDRLGSDEDTEFWIGTIILIPQKKWKGMDGPGVTHGQVLADRMHPKHFKKQVFPTEGPNTYRDDAVKDTKEETPKQ